MSRVYSACEPRESDYDSYEDYIYALQCYEDAVILAEMEQEDKED